MAKNAYTTTEINNMKTILKVGTIALIICATMLSGCLGTYDSKHGSSGSQYGIVSSDDSTIIGIGSGSGTTTLPITVTNGSNVGSVEVTLEFDPAVVKVTDMAGGDMEAVFWNIGDDQGRIGAYQTNNPGLNDTFTIAQITFKSVSSSGSCPLGILVTTFKDATPAGMTMAYTVSNGTYTATKGE